LRGGLEVPNDQVPMLPSTPLAMAAAREGEWSVSLTWRVTCWSGDRAHLSRELLPGQVSGAVVDDRLEARRRVHDPG